MRKRIPDYPCVKIEGVYHITTSSRTCLCGKEYKYGGVNMNSRTVITSPLRWIPFRQVTCEECRKRAEEGQKQ